MSQKYRRSVSLTRNSAKWPLRPPFRVRVYRRDIDGVISWHESMEARSFGEAAIEQRSLERDLYYGAIRGYAIDDCNGQRLAGDYPVDAAPPDLETA